MHFLFVIVPVHEFFAAISTYYVPLSVSYYAHKLSQLGEITFSTAFSRIRF